MKSYFPLKTSSYIVLVFYHSVEISDFSTPSRLACFHELTSQHQWRQHMTHGGCPRELLPAQVSGPWAEVVTVPCAGLPARCFPPHGSRQERVHYVPRS